MKKSSIIRIIVSVITFVLIINSYMFTGYAYKNRETQFSDIGLVQILETLQSNSCPHSGIYNFNDQSMMVCFYEETSIEYMIWEVNSFSGDLVRVFFGDEEIFEGEFQKGMKVQIYHGNSMYGEYEVGELLKIHSGLSTDKSVINSRSSESAFFNSSIGNEYGFILPIDNISLVAQSYGGNSSSFFGGGHRGIDIARGGTIDDIYGIPVRAVKAGTVTEAQTWDNTLSGNQSWGHYVKIEHDNNLCTLYAHMNAAPLVSVGTRVTQGQIIGYVGDTGNTDGVHLHFEVSNGISLLDPIPYLTNAPTYGIVPDTLTGDVNGDGFDDIVEMRDQGGMRQIITILGSETGSVSTTPIITNTTNSFVADDPIFIGDVDGDLHSDIIVHYVSASTGKRSFLIYCGKHDGTFDTPVRVNTTNTHNPDLYPCQMLVDDFTGDGCSDFLVHYKDTNGTRSTHLYKGLSSGGFAAAVKTTSDKTYVIGDPIFSADVNYDGLADIIVHWAWEGKRHLLTFTGNPSGSFSSPVDTATTNNHSDAYDSSFYTGDFNGDGCDDFLVHWSSVNSPTRHLLLYRGTTYGTFLTGVSTDTGFSHIKSDPVLIGDVNDDDIDDVIVEYNNGEYRAFNVYAGTSTGTFSSAVTTSTVNKRDSETYPSRIAVADITDEGRDDIVVIWKNTTGIENVIVYKGLSDKRFSTGVKTATGQSYYLTS